MVKSAEPTETSKCVRRPASRSRISRSKPIAAPSTAATTTRRRTSCQSSVATLIASIRGFQLGGGERLDAGRGEVEQLVQQLARERLALGCGLHLDETPVDGHDDVHVGLGARVLAVVEVEQGLPVDDADGHGGELARERLRKPEAV